MTNGLDRGLGMKDSAQTYISVENDFEHLDVVILGLIGYYMKQCLVGGGDV